MDVWLTLYQGPIITILEAFRRARKEKTRQVRSNVKVLLTVFYDCNGVVHYEFLPQGRTINKEYYFEIMRTEFWKNELIN